MALQMSDALARLRDELRFQPVHQRLRASYAGTTVLDTTGGVLVWEPRRVVPSYAVPRSDLDAVLHGTDQPAPDPAGVPPLLPPGRFAPHLAPGTVLDVEVGGTVLPGAAFAFDDPDLAGLVLLDWAPFAWREETEPMTGHPHDPFSRIKTLRSDRHVEVRFEDEVLADSHDAVLLLETGLPPRWYLPAADVLTHRLEPSSTHTVCAYKGDASYYSVTGSPAGDDLVWYYPRPRHDAAAVQDRLCFYAERTDLVLDGVAVPRPESPFARPAS